MIPITFCKIKEYSDKTQLRLKSGYILSSKEAALKENFISTNAKYSKYRKAKKEVNLANVKRSVARSRIAIYDILYENDFQYFITFTYNNSIDRYNDNLTRRKLVNYLNYYRKIYPSFFYCAVPEYHKKGALHFHLLVGGVTVQQLGLVDSGKRTKGKNNGQIIYNVNGWHCGYSTATIIRNAEASKKYVLKYITKQNTDMRFYNKKRYYFSKNCIRPKITKQIFEEEVYYNYMDYFDTDTYKNIYQNDQKKFILLENSNIQP